MNAGDWYLTTSAGSPAFGVDNGGANSGGVFSYGATSATNRALGILASTTSVSNIGAVFVNNTGSTINTLTVSFDGEQWRNGGSNLPDTLAFSYQVGGSAINTGTFTSASTLNFSSKVTSTTAGPLDGTQAANRSLVAGNITGLSWAPGQTLVLRWSDPLLGGFNDGLAIDNLVVGAVPSTIYVSPTFTGDPGSAIADADLGTPGNQPAIVGYNAFPTIAQAEAALGTATGTIVLNAGTYAENITSTSTGSLLLTSNAAVLINSVTGSAPITIDAGATLTLAPTAAATITGVISGLGSLVKSGIGTLDDNATNTYAGGTTISIGTLRTNNSSGLGTGQVVLGDVNTGSSAVAFLATTNNINFNNNFVVSSNGSGTATIGTISMPQPLQTRGAALSSARDVTLQAGNTGGSTTGSERSSPDRSTGPEISS